MIKNFKKPSFSFVVQYLKEYGFVFPHGKIYGGLMNAYDYGPLGTKIKQTIKAKWEKFFICSNLNIHQMDSGILTHEKILQASKHTSNFASNQGLLVEQLTEYDLTKNQAIRNQPPRPTQFVIPFTTLFQLFLFNKTNSKVQNLYLRPETAQNIFVNFNHVFQSLKLTLPFGLAQIGKAFRKEFVSNDFIMRSWEFEQMEIEYFYNEEKTSPEKIFAFWNEQIKKFLLEVLEISSPNIRMQNIKKDLPHYSRKTYDWEYHFPNGWREIIGLSDRTNFDLKNHSNLSQTKLVVQDKQNQNIYPSVIEPSFGIERIFMALICENLHWDNFQNKERLVLKLNEEFCYYKVALLPLTEKLTPSAQKLLEKLQNHGFTRICFDDRRSIGQRYRYHDAIGTKYCVTYDFDVEKTHKITVRERDTGAQKSVPLDSLISYLQ